MHIPSLDLHGMRHHEVENNVIRFLEMYLYSGMFLEIITGHSEKMFNEAINAIQQYGLQYHVGYPNHVGRIMVVAYDDLH